MTTAERIWNDARLDAWEAQARLAEASAAVNVEAGRVGAAKRDKDNAKFLRRRCEVFKNEY